MIEETGGGTGADADEPGGEGVCGIDDGGTGTGTDGTDDESTGTEIDDRECGRRDRGTDDGEKTMDSKRAEASSMTTGGEWTSGMLERTVQARTSSSEALAKIYSESSTSEMRMSP